MASVTVLCPNGRRCNVKVTPNTVLLQVLEQACAKQKFDPTLYTLKHHSKTLDLDLPFRYTTLPNFAQLEVVRADRRRTQDSEVVLAVQQEDGSRVQGKFPSTATLWEVLSQLDVMGDQAAEPVLMYMSHKLSGEANLKRQTLRDLGLSSGRAAMRLFFQPKSRSCEQTESTQELGTTIPADTLSAASGATSEQHHKDTPAPDVDEESAHKDTPAPDVDEESAHKDTDSKPSKTDELSETSVGATVQLKERENLQVSAKGKPTKGREKPPKAAPQKLLEPAEEPMDVGEEDLPYFPAHPISIFPPELEVDPEPTSVFAGAAPLNQPTDPEPAAAYQEEDSNPFSQSAILQSLLGAFMHIPPGMNINEPKSKPHPLPAPVSQPRVYDDPCEREMVVFRLDDLTLATPPTEDPPDSFFEVTVRDVHVMHSDLKKQVELAEGELLTQAMKQAKQERKREQYTKAVIRVHFPDQWVLQGCFRPRESLKALVRFIRENLANPQLKFHLYTTPPKQVLKSGRMTFVEAGFLPAAIVHLGTESEERPLLSDACLAHAQSALHAEVIHQRERTGSLDRLATSSSSGEPSTAQGNTLPSQPQRPRAGQPRSDSERRQPSTGSAATSQKVPKWFKKGK